MASLLTAAAGILFPARPQVCWLTRAGMLPSTLSITIIMTLAMTGLRMAAHSMLDVACRGHLSCFRHVLACHLFTELAGLSMMCACGLA